MKSHKIFKVITALLFTLVLSSTASAQEDAPAQSSSELATQLEELKSQVLQLNRELFILEEDLLFPASTQIAFFVSVDTGKFFAIDSVEVKINDKDVVGFLYTDRQRAALEQGGVQKLHLGNLKMGLYQLTVIFNGIDADGRTVKRAAEYQFEKGDEAIMLELKVVDDTASYRSKVIIEEWIL